ncbi:MAG: hypothetical protein LBK82_13950 [Planctomycetaceae bacterium]|jgi:hypothetical protein|nr:hypothetical protein [Planctomycetaceae bacterium]
MDKFISNKQVTILFGITGILCFNLIAGCSNTPDGFPNIVPCVVTITDNGTPVEGVFVQIETVPRIDSLSAVAKTDAQGNAAIQTQLGTFAQSGVPVGKLVMVLTKVPEVPDFKSAEEREKMTYDQAMAYGAEIEARRAKLPLIIPLALTDFQTSSLTRDVVSGNSIRWNVALEEYRKK